MIGFAAFLAAIAAQTAQPSPQPPVVLAAAPVDPARLALAHRVVVKMRAIEEVRFALGKLKVVFAQQVIASAAQASPNPFASYLTTEAGKVRLTDMLGDEFVKAFDAHIADVEAAVAGTLASELSIEDLRATDAFLDTPAGKNWAAATVKMQNESSAAGRQVGATAGAEVVAATLKRIDAESRQIK